MRRSLILLCLLALLAGCGQGYVPEPEALNGLDRTQVQRVRFGVKGPYDTSSYTFDRGEDPELFDLAMDAVFPAGQQFSVIDKKDVIYPYDAWHWSLTFCDSQDRELLTVYIYNDWTWPEVEMLTWEDGFHTLSRRGVFYQAAEPLTPTRLVERMSQMERAEAMQRTAEAEWQLEVYPVKQGETWLLALELRWYPGQLEYRIAAGDWAAFGASLQERFTGNPAWDPAADYDFPAARTENSWLRLSVPLAAADGEIGQVEREVREHHFGFTVTNRSTLETYHVALPPAE